jgi:predicted transcriptional regulator of viral defense system
MTVSSVTLAIENTVLILFKEFGTMTPKQLANCFRYTEGYQLTMLQRILGRLVAAGVIERIERGIYRLVEAPIADAAE